MHIAEIALRAKNGNTCQAEQREQHIAMEAESREWQHLSKNTKADMGAERQRAAQNNNKRVSVHGNT